MASPLSRGDATPGLPGIGVITVKVQRSYILFTVISLLLLVGIGVTAWALWRSRLLEPAIATSSGAVKGVGAHER